MSIIHTHPQFLDGKPTYRFREGAIGESYALEVAERLELPTPVLQRARALMDSSVVKVTELIKELESQRDALQGEILAAQEREEELTREKKAMDVKMKELEDKQIELDRLKYRAKLEVYHIITYVCVSLDPFDERGSIRTYTST